MTYDAQALLRLLPELYETADGDDGPLRALLDVLAGPAEAVDASIRQLYDDLFVETCAEWAVPYIGDLLGVRGLHRVEAATYSQRGWVANALALRRRKGTLSSIRQLAQDVTGYRAAAVEMFALLEWTQNDDHLRLQNPRTPDLRDSNPLELVETAFNRASLTGDVRSIEARRGKANIPNVAITLWRLGDYPLAGVRPKKIGTQGYAFSPLGLDIPLFNSPEAQGGLVVGPAAEPDVPALLRRRAVHDDLEAMRAALAAGGTHASPYFDADPPVFRIVADGVPVPPEEIFVCNLETWGVVPGSRLYPGGSRPIRLGVDPLRGRLRFVAGQEPAGEIRVDYGYGFGSALGGGPYDRTPTLAELLPTPPDWTRIVDGAALTLDAALADWNLEGEGKRGLIVVSNNDTHGVGTAIEIRGESHLTLLAATWVDPTDRRTLSPNGVRPHLQGDLAVTGLAGADPERTGSFTLAGFLVEGSLTVAAGNLGTLRMVDSTLVPPIGGLRIGDNLRLEARIERAILSEVQVAGPIARLSLVDAIVEGTIEGDALPLVVERCTVGGDVACRRIDASDSIFVRPLVAERTQVGCVRFSFVPEGSRAPRVYRCQPDLTIEEGGDPFPLTPCFVSKRYGDPSYFLLSDATADAIRAGASNGDEMGAYNRELHTLREANLRFALQDTLRVGLEAGIFHGN